MFNAHKEDHVMEGRIWLTTILLASLVYTPVLLAELPDGWVDASGYGFNTTDATEAIEAALCTGRNVFVPNMGTDWIIKPITLHRSNQELLFESGVVVTAKKGEFLGTTDSLFSASGKRDISITGYGATFRMWKDDYTQDPYPTAQWRTGLAVSDCENVTIKGLKIESTGGDGIYLGGTLNRNVVIKDVTCDNNYRQGISVITGENVLIDHCVLRNTYGTGPMAGIDFEPNNANNRVVNCTVRNTVIEGNAGVGICVALSHWPDYGTDASINIENCTVVGNGWYGLLVADGFPGLNVQDSIFVDNNDRGVYQRNEGSARTVVDNSCFWGNGYSPISGYARLGSGSIYRTEPLFESMDLGDPHYMWLAEDCSSLITLGDSDGGYMGARPVVPEPSTVYLLLSGVLCGVLCQRRGREVSSGHESQVRNWTGASSPG